MRIVTIPLLNITMKLNPIAFTIFNIDIYWYAIIIVASIILAIFLLKIKDTTFNIKYDDILDLAIILIPISFIGARLYYILFNLQSYNSIQDVLNLKDGGLAIYGGIIAGIIVIYYFCKKRKINMLDLLDYIAPILVLSQAIGRWGNFINVEAYGVNTQLPWKMGIKNLNEIQYVHPTFLYESIADFIIFWILNKISKKRKFKGQIIYLYLLVYSFIRFFIEGLRTDSLMIGDFRISQIISILLFIFGSIMTVKQLKKIAE